jgi:hypothetical protein
MGSVSHAELQNWQDSHDAPIQDRDNRAAKDRARYAIRKARHQDFIRTAMPEARKKFKTAEDQRPVLSVKSDSQMKVILIDGVSSQMRSAQEEPLQSSPVGPQILSKMDDEEIGNDTVSQHEIDNLHARLGLAHIASQVPNHCATPRLVPEDDPVALEELLTTSDTQKEDRDGGLL